MQVIKSITSNVPEIQKEPDNEFTDKKYDLFDRLKSYSEELSKAKLN